MAKGNLSFYFVFIFSILSHIDIRVKFSKQQIIFKESKQTRFIEVFLIRKEKSVNLSVRLIVYYQQ